MQKVEPNKHIRDYLSYYLSINSAPGYAVLLSGPWGVGKTYLVKKLLSKLTPERTNHIYVSLFGARSHEDIDAALLLATYPALDTSITRHAMRIGSTAVKYFGVEWPYKAKDLLSKSAAALYVFDDIERSEMSIGQVLGYINSFVEHDGCKVLIVANESEITKDLEYYRRREKVIGKVLLMAPELDEALDHFISQSENGKTSELFHRYRATILAVFTSSGINNLRILQQTLWDFERLYGHLTKPIAENIAVMNTLLPFFFALSFEVKAGRLLAPDLQKRYDQIVYAHLAKGKDKPQGAFAEANARYPDVALEDPILSDKVITELLIEGVIRSEEIHDCILRSYQMSETGEEPAWRVVWHSLERTDQEFETAYEALCAQIESLDFVVPGEILHVCGLLLWLSKIQSHNRTLDEVVADCKNYIDRLYANGKLLPASDDDDRRDEFTYSAFSGLAMFESETPQFLELRDYLAECRQRRREDLYPDWAETLLNELLESPDIFCTRLIKTNADDGVYHKTPILALIEPDAFAAALLSIHPSSMRQVFRTLRERYEFGCIDRKFPGEKTWLTSVVRALRSATRSLTPLARARVDLFIAQSIASVIEDSESSA